MCGRVRQVPDPATAGLLRYVDEQRVFRKLVLTYLLDDFLGAVLGHHNLLMSLPVNLQFRNPDTWF
jgi:hypothetical protein